LTSLFLAGGDPFQLLSFLVPTDLSPEEAEIVSSRIFGTMTEWSLAQSFAAPPDTLASASSDEVAAAYMKYLIKEAQNTANGIEGSRFIVGFIKNINEIDASTIDLSSAHTVLVDISRHIKIGQYLMAQSMQIFEERKTKFPTLYVIVDFAPLYCFPSLDAKLIIYPVLLAISDPSRNKNKSDLITQRAWL
jgi:hypothetical protein